MVEWNSSVNSQVISELCSKGNSWTDKERGFLLSKVPKNYVQMKMSVVGEIGSMGFHGKKLSI